MPVDRLLHPRIGDSEKVAQLTDMEFRVWVTYVLAADDYGVLPMTAAKIQGADRTLGNRRKVQIDRALETLVSIALVRVFDHQGATFIYTPCWQSYQQIRYPRKTHYPAPPADVLDRECDTKTVLLFRKFHSDFAVEDPRHDGNTSDTDQTPARAGGRETANGYGSRLTAMATADGDPPMDVWARELVNLYPAQGRCAWNMVERPLHAALSAECLERDVSPRMAWANLQARLEQHKRSHQWRVKGMIPRLDKWLREGLHLQELPEAPAAAEQVSARTARMLAG